MIESIRHRGLRRAHERGDFRKVHTTRQERIATILSDLDMAGEVSDLDLPAYRLHPLKGEMAGFWRSTRIAQLANHFRFEEGDVYDVNLVDYH